MNLRGQKASEEFDISINLVSFIDVLLCLVIFFMVSTNFVTRSTIGLNLPKATAETSAADEDNRIEVSVNAQGQASVNNIALADSRKESLQRALQDSLRSKATDRLVINADAGTTHQSIVDVLDAASRVGLVRVSFATDRMHNDP